MSAADTVTEIQIVAEAAQSCADTLLREWLPDGKQRGDEYWPTNPVRGDRQPGSFSINLRTGKWSDFASGDKGRDLVSLRAYLLGCKQSDAAADIARNLVIPGLRLTGDQSPASAEAIQQRQAEADAKRQQREDEARREEERCHAEAAERARAIHAAGSSDLAGHPYFERKGRLNFGSAIRRGRWGQNGWDDALLVPIFGPDQKIMSIEAISPSGDKMALKGGAKAGCIYPLAPFKRHETGIVIVAEGLATAAACMASTGYPAVVAFSAGNLRRAAEVVRAARQDARIVIAADVGAEQEAGKAAAAVGGVVAVTGIAEKGADFWDVWHLQGADAVAEAIERAIHGEPAASAETVVVPEQQVGAEVVNLDRARTAREPARAAEAPVAAQSEADAPRCRDEHRRRLQQEENARIQEAQLGVMFPSRISLDEMVQDLVWIAEGEQVAHVSPNRTMFLSFREMRSLTAESTTYEPGEGMKKPIPNAVLWQRDARRRNVMTRTFRAGAGVVCADPEGKMAVNTWRPMRRWEAKADIGLFLGHVEYLFADPVERSAFLDWLAHLEQKPGELPHYGWLHVASHTGCGRNWLASVLARVWRGYVAPNVDLPALLDSPYNGCLSGRVLAIVDEVQEGGGENSYRHTNKLRSLVNAEYRDVNPKFGRQYREHNACRWLVFSNHLNALPIGDTDRRWRVMVHSAAPRSADTYGKLYAALNDPEFINAVAVFLQTRDISQFKPGERPPMNAAKLSVVGASKSLTQQRAEEIMARWPSDIISNTDAAEILSEGIASAINPSMRRSLEELGAIAINRQIKIGGKAQRLWIIRNHSKWDGTTNAAIVAEFERAREGLYPHAEATVVLAEDRDASSGSAPQCDDSPI